MRPAFLLRSGIQNMRFRLCLEKRPLGIFMKPTKNEKTCMFSDPESTPENTHGLSQKIQGTYFKTSALYFKIYGLYFLQHGLCFFSCAHFASRITLLRVCLCANKWKYSAYGLGKSENIFRKNCNEKPAAAYNVCKGACAAPHAKDA